MIEVRCFDSLESAAHLREEIDALNRASTRPNPFSSFEFFENYLRHDEDATSGPRPQLWFLTAFEGGRLVGYLALKLTKARAFGITSPVLGFLVTRDTDRPHVVTLPERQREVGVALYQYILGRGREWALLELQQQDETSVLFPPPVADLDGYLLRQWSSMENCTIRIRWDTLREYVEGLTKKFRSNLSRQMRNLLAAGRVEVVSSSDPSVTPVLLDLYRGIELHSWKSRARASIGRHPTRVAYFQGLLDPSQPMRISIQVLLLDGVPVAGFITGAFMDGLYALHIVYDERVSRLAPGSMMLLLGVRRAIEGRFKFFNLLSGFGYFKAKWLAEVTETRIAQLYRTGSALFWRRIFGDLKRSVFSAQSRARVRFNPTRRSVGVADVEVDGDEPLTAPDDEVRMRVACVIDAVRDGRAEHLSAAEIGATLLSPKQRYETTDRANGLAQARA
jgi:CelD/BcsL family acetyltransferase involved in cellulose biosynthesis